LFTSAVTKDTMCEHGVKAQLMLLSGQLAGLNLSTCAANIRLVSSPVSNTLPGEIVLTSTVSSSR